MENQSPRVALAWELGNNFGHVAELLTAGRALADAGVGADLMLRELHGLSQEDAKGFRTLQAPVFLPQVQGLPDPPLSYAEILLRFGYHDAGSLMGLVSGWRAAFELAGSHVVVASHAPTALLAARSLGIPAVTIGSGFYVPPRTSPTPNMRHWMPVPAERLAASDQWATRSMNQVLAEYGRPPLGCVAELFDISANLFCTFPELDHYFPRIPEMQRGVYCGSLFSMQRGAAMEWPPGQGSKILVYLRPEIRDFEAVMTALRSLDCRVIAVTPGISPSQQSRFESQHLRICRDGVQLEPLAAGCDLAISYAGHGFVSAMLASGVPLLLLPSHLEQFLLASRVCNMGAGVLVNPESPPPDYVKVLQNMLDDPSYKNAAQGFATKHSNLTQTVQMQAIAQLIEKAACP